MAQSSIVLLGGGHAHVEVLRRFARRPRPGLRLTLVAREPRTLCTGMLPGVLRGEYALRDATIDLAALAEVAGARLIAAEAVGLDLDVRRVRLANGAQVPFELLSLDVGGISAMSPADGVPVKPIGRFLDEWAHLEQSLPADAQVAIVGGGPGGVELALALAERWRTQLRLTLVSAGAEPLADTPACVRRVSRLALLDAGIALVSGVRAVRRTERRLILSDGSFLEADAVLWATGVIGPVWLAAAGLDCDDAGCVRVDGCLRSLSHDFVFAAGDCAALTEAPRPKGGVWAVRAGGPLAENLRRAASHRTLRRWRPQTDAVVIVGLGGGRATAWRNGIAISGRAPWWLKDQIDRRWIRRYQRL